MTRTIMVGRERGSLYGFLGLSASVVSEDFKPLIASLLAISLDFAYNFLRGLIKQKFNKNVKK